MNVTAIAPQMTVEWKFSFKQSGGQDTPLAPPPAPPAPPAAPLAATAYKENVLVAARKLAQSFTPRPAQAEQQQGKGDGAGSQCHLEL